MDFVIVLPDVPFEGSAFILPGFPLFNSLFTITCKWSRVGLIILGYTEYIVEDWALVLFKALLASNWGLPRVIISDRDLKFTSDL